MEIARVGATGSVTERATATDSDSLRAIDWPAQGPAAGLRLPRSKGRRPRAAGAGRPAEASAGRAASRRSGPHIGTSDAAGGSTPRTPPPQRRTGWRPPQFPALDSDATSQGRNLNWTGQWITRLGRGLGRTMALSESPEGRNSISCIKVPAGFLRSFESFDSQDCSGTVSQVTPQGRHKHANKSGGKVGFIDITVK